MITAIKIFLGDSFISLLFALSWCPPGIQFLHLFSWFLTNLLTRRISRNLYIKWNWKEKHLAEKFSWGVLIHYIFFFKMQETFGGRITSLRFLPCFEVSRLESVFVIMQLFKVRTCDILWFVSSLIVSSLPFSVFLSSVVPFSIHNPVYLLSPVLSPSPSLLLLCSL